MIPDTQHLRDALGRADAAAKAHEAQRKDMHADLIGQREAMTRAIFHIGKGDLRKALEVLTEELQRRERTREQRKVTV